MENDKHSDKLTAQKKPLRTEDTDLLELIYKALNEKGRIHALLRCEIIDPELAHTLEALKRKKRKKEYGNESEKIAIQEKIDSLILKIRGETTELRGLWEGYHLIEYATDVRDRKYVSEEDFNNALQEYDITDGFEWIQKAPTQSTIGKKKAQKIFNVLRTAQAEDMSMLECLLDFLIFCRGKEYSFEAFNYQLPGLDEAIVDITNYLAGKPEADFTKDISDQTNISPKVPAIINFDQSDTLSDYSYNLNLQDPPTLEGNRNYYGNQTIAVIGRDEKQDKLREFLNCDRRYTWLQLAGAAGQGKSRLALELVIEARNHGWKAGLFDEHELKKMTDHWENWQPQKPHLIILDYVIGRIENVRPCFQVLARRRESFQHPVRFLLLERQRWDFGFSAPRTQRKTADENLSFEIPASRAEWFIDLTERYDGNDVHVIQARFETGVLELKKLTPDVLAEIVKQIVSQNSDISDCISDDQIKKQLDHIDMEGRPLYAYFFAQALLQGKDTKGWSRTDLLHATLERERANWWAAAFKKEPPLLEDDIPAMRIALLATMVGSINCKEAYRQAVLPNASAEVRREALAITGSSLTKGITGPSNEIPAMQPDILGEWFVLASLGEGLPVEGLTGIAWQYSPKNMAGFVQRVSQDFGDHCIVKEILNYINIEKINVNILPSIASTLLIHFNENGVPVSEKLVTAIQMAARNNDSIAMRILGSCYLNGIGVEQDEKKAFIWLRKAAEAGQVYAMSILGICFANGIGVRTNERLAYEWAKKAAEVGDTTAMLNLGICYRTGIGVEPNERLALEWVKSAAELGDASAMDNLGFYYEIGCGVEPNEYKAFEWFQRAAEANHATAMGHLAFCYEKGFGVEPDEDKAFEYFQKGAEAGDATAMRNLGICYRTGAGVKPDENKALEWLFKASHADDPTAMAHLGVCFEEGIGVETDKHVAFKWFLKAAEANYPPVMVNLGVSYQNGIGVEPNERKAFEWFLKSAEADHVPAMRILGLCYQNGTGVEPNERKAFEWFQKAAEADHAPAITNLGICFQNGRGVEKDERKAFEWFLIAAKANHKLAMFLIAHCYQNSTGVEPDENKAFKWFQKAAEADYVLAMVDLGRCYQIGKGVTSNEHKAFEWYKKAALLGDATAKFNLGVCCQYGIGIEPDEHEAFEWYKKAAEDNYVDAIYRLALCYQEGIGVKRNFRNAFVYFGKAAEKGNQPAHEYLVAIKRFWEKVFAAIFFLLSVVLFLMFN